MHVRDIYFKNLQGKTSGMNKNTVIDDTRRTYNFTQHLRVISIRFLFLSMTPRLTQNAFKFDAVSDLCLQKWIGFTSNLDP